MKPCKGAPTHCYVHKHPRWIPAPPEVAVEPWWYDPEPIPPPFTPPRWQDSIPGRVQDGLATGVLLLFAPLIALAQWCKAREEAAAEAREDRQRTARARQRVQRVVARGRFG